MAVTEAQTKTMWQDVVRPYDQVRLAGAVNSGTLGGVTITNWITAQATQQTNLTGSYAPDISARMLASRAKLAALMLDIGGSLQPVLRQYGEVLNVPETSPNDILTRIVDDYIKNNKRIMSRGFSFGALTNGSPLVGNGTVYRLLVDQDGVVLENQTADTKTIQCVQDALSGASGRNAEIFELRGQTTNRDTLAIAGSGQKTSLKAVVASDSNPYLRNPSFSQLAGTATVPTDITGWTSSITVNAANYQFLTDTYANQGVGYYRDYPGDTTPYALQCLATTWSLTQSLEQNRNVLSARNVPYFFQVAYKKSSAGTDGTLTLSLGATSTSVSLGGVGDTNWHVLTVPLGKGNWFKNIDAANLTFTLSRSGGTTGTVTIDDVLMTPMTFFDGSWWAVVGGTTQSLYLDNWTVADTELGEGYGVIQKWLWRGFGRYLPAIPKAPTAAPTVALSATAGAVTTGTHVVAYTYVDQQGIESGLSPASTSVTGDGAHKVDCTGITVGPAGTTKRKVYMSKAGTTTPFFLVATINDNSTTTQTGASGLDGADGSLSTQATAVVAAGVTFLDP